MQSSVVQRIPMTTIAVAQNIRYHYGTRTALDDVSFSVATGMLFGLLGPNGSGKTTLFRLLATLIPMQSGELSVCGFDVTTQQSAVRRQLGVTFQSPAVDVRLTVAENLRCHGSIYGLSGATLNHRVSEMLNQFGIADRRQTIVGTLSGGLKRRVELAKGLMHDPKVLLLDEPTSGLDPRARQEFWELVTAQQKTQGTTIIVATHLMPEAELCDRVLLLDRGRTVAEGAPMELQSQLNGERLTVRLRDAARHVDSLRAMIGGNVEIQGDRIRLRARNPAEQIREIMQAFGDQILGLELTRPSLEDVFLELTGRSLSQTGDTNAP
ncbi:MAG: ABC transporter ATP-binding protein [Planctomycetota bacterium]|nr:MAG: ABC transporter ATP-binding protein [Planctomycetota bacterium]